MMGNIRNLNDSFNETMRRLSDINAAVETATEEVLRLKVLWITELNKIRRAELAKPKEPTP